MRFALLMMLVGCGRFGFDDRIDAGDSDGATPCNTGTWGPPELVAGVSDGNDNDLAPTVSADGLTILFGTTGPSITFSDIVMAQRPTRTSDFSPRIVVAELNGAERDGDPTLSADNTHVYFTSDRLGNMFDFRMYVSTWTGTTFSPPVELAELGYPVYGPCISADELELFFGDGNLFTYRSTRADTTAPWGVPVAVPELGEGTWATLSPDGLTIYFETHREGTARMYSATRSARGATFSPPQPVDELNAPFLDVSDPFVSVDGRTIYFAATPTSTEPNSIYQSTRSCP